MSLTYELQLYTLWKNAKVPDDLITNYASFLKHRDLLPYMRFNPNVMHALVKLIQSLYWTDAKISRTSLLVTTRRYWDQNQLPLKREHVIRMAQSNAKEDRKALFPETQALLVELCVKILCNKPMKGQDKQIQLLQSTANLLIKNVSLGEDQIAILLKNLHRCEHVFNRVLRHPVQSPLISAWALKYFQHNRFRRRRAEMLAWLLNEDPNYVVTYDLLIADFEHANEEDKLEVERATGQYPEASVLEETFPDLFSTKPNKDVNQFMFGADEDKWVQGASLKTRFFERNYRISVLPTRPSVYDPARLIQFFYTNLDVTQRVTMLWGIYYSHLPIAQKRSMLKKWHSPATKKSFSRICLKMNDLTLLGWFLKNTE